MVHIYHCDYNHYKDMITRVATTSYMSVQLLTFIFDEEERFPVCVAERRDVDLNTAGITQ